jgi:hypothetical protein
MKIIARIFHNLKDHARIFHNHNYKNHAMIYIFKFLIQFSIKTPCNHYIYIYMDGYNIVEFHMNQLIQLLVLTRLKQIDMSLSLIRPTNPSS